MRWTRELRLTSVTRADGEVVWSWRPDAGAKLCGDDLRSDGGKRARSPGRARRKPLKPLRREGRIASAEPVCSCAFSYVHLHTRPRVQRAPGFPCALYFLRVKSCARLGHFMPRECGPMPSRREFHGMLVEGRCRRFFIGFLDQGRPDHESRHTCHSRRSTSGVQTIA
jgi:hypothetical protein